MNKIAVWVVDDAYIPVKEFLASIEEQGYVFSADLPHIPVCEADERTEVEAFAHWEVRLKSQARNELVFIDMAYETITLSADREALLASYFPDVTDWLLDGRMKVGLYLTILIAKNQAFSGTVALASSHLPHGQFLKIEAVLNAIRSENNNASALSLEFCGQAIAGSIEEMTRVVWKGIRRYVKDHGDPVTLFTSPPGCDIDSSMEWFANGKAHDLNGRTKALCVEHLSAAQALLGAPIAFEEAKALLFSNRLEFRLFGECHKSLGATALAQMLGVDSVGFEDNEQICLPLTPAWPFLLSLKILIKDLSRKEIGSARLFKVKSSDVVTLLIPVEDPAFLLERWLANRGASLTSLEWALRARVIMDTEERGRKEFSKLLRGAECDLAVPVFTAEGCGLSWPAVFRHKKAA